MMFLSTNITRYYCIPVPRISCYKSISVYCAWNTKFINVIYIVYENKFLVLDIFFCDVILISYLYNIYMQFNTILFLLFSMLHFIRTVCPHLYSTRVAINPKSLFPLRSHIIEYISAINSILLLLFWANCYKCYE